MAKIIRDTIDVFTVSDEVKQLTKKEKLALIKDYFQKKYQGKTVTYERLGEEVTASINAATGREYKIKGKNESWKQFKTRINIGASNEFMTLIEGAAFHHSSDEEKREQNTVHHNTKKWHYFQKPIMCDNELYSVRVDVREDLQGVMRVHSVSLNDLGDDEIEEIKNEMGNSVHKDTKSTTHLDINTISSEEGFVNAFREKTDELFNREPFGGLSPEEIEDDVRAYISSTLYMSGLNHNVEIDDVIIVGSRCRGINHPGSDLDIVFSYKSPVVEGTRGYKEDELFNLLNEYDENNPEDKMLHELYGHKIDINPIRPEETGSLAEYLKNAEAYLDERLRIRDTIDKAVFNKDAWGIEYIDYRGDYRIYQIDHPSSTVAYVDSIEEARKQALEEYGKDVYVGTVTNSYDKENNVMVPHFHQQDEKGNYVKEEGFSYGEENKEEDHGFNIYFYDKESDDGFIKHILNKHKINDMECFFQDDDLYLKDDGLTLKNEEIFAFLSDVIYGLEGSAWKEAIKDNPYLLTDGEVGRFNELKNYFTTNISGYLGIDLQDDSSETGGTSFKGETVYDFAIDVGLNSEDPLYKLNRILEENGIKKISLSGDAIDLVEEKMKASEFAEYFDFYLDFNENKEEDEKYQVTDNQGVFHTRYINNVSELVGCFDSMLHDYVDTVLEEHGFEYSEQQERVLGRSYYDQAKYWIENEDRYAPKDGWGSLYGSDTYQVICCMVNPENIEDDLDVAIEKDIKMQNRLDIERLYTLDEVYEEADGKALLSPELKRKDEALTEFTDWLHKNGYMDERSSYDSWEDAMDDTVRAWNITALFSENGTLLYLKEGDNERLNELEKDYIYELSPKQINNMLDDFSNDKPSLPEGLFYERGNTVSGEPVFTAIDNSGGEMYMEDFKTYYSMVHYLEGEDTDSLHEREREWERGLDGGRTVIQLFRHEIDELKRDINVERDSEVFERFRNETFTKDFFKSNLEVDIDSFDDLKMYLGRGSMYEELFNAEFNKEFPDGRMKYYKASYDDEVSKDTLLEIYQNYLEDNAVEDLIPFKAYYEDAIRGNNYIWESDYMYDSFKYFVNETLIPAYTKALEEEGYRNISFGGDFESHMYEWASEKGLWLDFVEETAPQDIKINIGISTPTEQNYDHGSLHGALSLYYGNDINNGIRTSSFKDYKPEDLANHREIIDYFDNGLSYLIQQQGYTVDQVFRDSPEKGFPSSVMQECDNFYNYMGRLTALSRVDFNTFSSLATLQKGLGNPSEITFPKNTEIGFFNEWQGSGSLLEIELNKPFSVPSEYISHIQIETGYSSSGQGYTVDSVYGLGGSAWWEGLEIKDNPDLPKLNMKEIEEGIKKIIEREGEKMTVKELSKEQLRELKERYYTEKMDNLGEGVSYGEYAEIDNLVTDEEIFAEYEGYSFTNDDFFAKEENEMANEMEKNGVTVEAPEGEKSDVKKVYIALNKKFCHQAEDKFAPEEEKGRLFNTMTMPKGTVLNGQDISGCTIHPKYMNESQNNDKMMVATYYVKEGETLEIKLNKEGMEAQKVNVEELKAAVDAQKTAYAEKMQEQEKQKEAQKNNEQTKEKDAGEEVE